MNRIFHIYKIENAYQFTFYQKIKFFTIVVLSCLTLGNRTLLKAQPIPLKLTISNSTACSNEKACVHVTVHDFDKVQSIQFSFSYNPNLVIPDCPVNYVNPNIKKNIFGPILNCDQKTSGTIFFVWGNDTLATIPDGDTLFTICFNVLGPKGSSSELSFNGSKLPIEVCKQDSSGAVMCINELISNVGKINIACQELLSVNSSGGDAESLEGSVSYSIGQVFYQWNEQGDVALSEGVQQPYRITTVEVENKNFDLGCKVFPNPTNSHVSIQLIDDQSRRIKYSLYNLIGTLIDQGEITGNQTQIEMELLPAGTYVLAITNEDNHIKTYKIIKQLQQ